jgi:hypothetical protein
MGALDGRWKLKTLTRGSHRRRVPYFRFDRHDMRHGIDPRWLTDV